MYASAILSGHDLDLCLLTFEIFAEMPSHVLNISDEFHRNPSTEYGDTASHEIGVVGRTTNGRRDG